MHGSEQSNHNKRLLKMREGETRNASVHSTNYLVSHSELILEDKKWMQSGIHWKSDSSNHPFKICKLSQALLVHWGNSHNPAFPLKGSYYLQGATNFLIYLCISWIRIPHDTTNFNIGWAYQHYSCLHADIDHWDEYNMMHMHIY